MAPLADSDDHQVEGGATEEEGDLDADVKALGLRLRRVQASLGSLQLLALLVHPDLVVDLLDLGDHALVPGAGGAGGGGAGGAGGEEAEPRMHFPVRDDEGELLKLWRGRLAPGEVLAHRVDESEDPPQDPLLVDAGPQLRPEAHHAVVLLGGGVVEAVLEVGRAEVREVDDQEAVGLHYPLVVGGRCWCRQGRGESGEEGEGEDFAHF